MKKAEIDEILVPGDEPGRESRVKAGFCKAANRIPFMEDVVASYYCAMDPETPARVRGILFAALAYFVLPLDTIPDFLMGFGFTDDIAVLGAAIAAIRGHLKDTHRIAAKAALSRDPE